MIFAVVVPQLYYAHQGITRGLDMAAIAGATQADQALLLQNNIALNKPLAVSVARNYAARNLASFQQFFTVPAATIANTSCGAGIPTNCMIVTAANTGEADPWGAAGATVSQPTVFIEAWVQVTGLATYGVIGTAPGMLSNNPLAGPQIHVRVKSSLRSHS